MSRPALPVVGAVNAERIADLAMKMIGTWSPPGHEAVVAGLVARELTAAGADDVYLDEEFRGSPSVVAWLRGHEPGPTVQWHGHLDAIATPHPEMRREGNVIYGRGACDMKGAIAAMVESVRLLHASGIPRRGQILITFHGLHEEGGNAPLYGLIRRGIVGDAAIIGELGSGDELVVSSPGLTFWDLLISRAGDSMHETLAGPQTVNPLIVGHRLLGDLLDLRERLARRSLGPQGSLFIGKMVSGDYYNRVPTRCEISGTRRHEADSSLDEVRNQLLDLVDRVKQETSANIEAEIRGLAEAYEIDPECRIARALRKAHHDLTDQAMHATRSKAVGNAVSFVQTAHIPAVYYGCRYDSAHSDLERAEIPELARIAGVFALASFYFLDESPSIEAPDLPGA